jgi:hypothetical protein
MKHLELHRFKKAIGAITFGLFFPNENIDLLILTSLTSSYSAYLSPGSPTKEKSISPKK